MCCGISWTARRLLLAARGHTYRKGENMRRQSDRKIDISYQGAGVEFCKGEVFLVRRSWQRRLQAIHAGAGHVLMSYAKASTRYNSLFFCKPSLGSVVHLDGFALTWNMDAAPC